MATWANQTKTASSWATGTIHSSSWTDQSKSTSGAVIATAGLYYGFGAFTYTGGQVLTPGTAPTWNNVTKN